MRRLTILFWVLLAATVHSRVQAQVRHEIHFPDLPGYTTLKCDLHMHTVFSDGVVWPTVRVDEGWRIGLDAIAITDHIEYQSHKDDIATNHNRPYELAVGRARERDLLLPRAAEITRDTPPGHFNAIFLENVEPLETDDFVEAVKRANQQGAFVFWNHQAWKGSEQGQWLPVHTQLLDNGWLHAMEVCNGQSYYPEAHQWCLDKNLTMMGTSDIHEPDLRLKNAPDDHRTMTLVLAKERTLAGLKEALVEKQTVVWFQNQVIGRREILEPLFYQCIRIAQPHLRTQKALWVKIHNTCDLDLELVRTGSVGPQELRLPARTVSLVKIPGGGQAAPLKLAYTATNFLIAPDTTLSVTLQIPE